MAIRTTMMDVNVALAARLRSLVRLVGPTAHDVRGALNIIQLNIELLAGAESGGLQGDVGFKQRLDTIRRACDRLYGVVGSFVEQVTLPDQRVEADLACLLRLVVGAVQPVARERNVGLTIRELPAGVGDRESYRQAVLDALLVAVSGAPAEAVVAIDVARDGSESLVLVSVNGVVQATIPATCDLEGKAQCPMPCS